MAEFWLFISIASVIVVVMLLAFVVGAWVHHKGFQAGSGYSGDFVGSPKGDAFSVDTGEGFDYEDEPSEAEKRVRERAGIFAQGLGGGNG